MEEIAERYSRQACLARLGREGQRALGRSSVLIVGCGALGCVAAGMLARAGVGRLRLVDRDIVELANLHRQGLFSERDAAEGTPKAAAAAEALRAANSEIEIEGVVADLNWRNAPALSEGAGLIVDGTDNFETRLLLNDVALERGTPWIYGGAVAAQGVAKAVVPGRTSCLRCLVDSTPAPGQEPTSETDGVIATAPHMVAGVQTALAIRLLIGDEEVPGDIYVVDAWSPDVHSIAAPVLRDCPACQRGERRFLGGAEAAEAALLCGAGTVQVLPAVETKLDLEELAGRLRCAGKIENKRFYLALDDGELRISIFRDGRCVVRGTKDIGRARAAVAKYLGG